MPAALPPAFVAALAGEVEDAAALLLHGRQQLRDLRFVSRTAPVVLACLSTGIEKLQKLTIGLAAMDGDGSWPSPKAMKQHGHDIVALDVRCRELIEQRLHRSSVPAYLRMLLDDTAGDPVLRGLLGMFSRYARSGRFHNLDTLGGDEPCLPSPRELWEQTEQGLWLTDPALLRRLASLDQPVHDQARREFYGHLDTSLASWQRLHGRAWQHGILGGQAQSWSARLL